MSPATPTSSTDDAPMFASVPLSRPSSCRGPGEQHQLSMTMKQVAQKVFFIIFRTTTTTSAPRVTPDSADDNGSRWCELIDLYGEIESDEFTRIVDSLITKLDEKVFSESDRAEIWEKATQVLHWLDWIAREDSATAEAFAERLSRDDRAVA